MIHPSIPARVLSVGVWLACGYVFLGGCDNTGSFGDAGVHAGPRADAGPRPDAAPWVTASHPPPFQFQNLGGPTLQHPSLITVTWSGDTMTDFVRAFDAWIATSNYLGGALAEYGIGAGAHAGSFAFATAAPAQIDFVDIGKALKDAIDAGALAAPTPDRVYVVYTPAGTTVTQLGAPSCRAFAGTHGSYPAAAATIVYAVVPRCHGAYETDQNLITLAASHEIAEAVTDPIASDHAWFGADQNLGSGGEIADACPASFASVNGYKIQRLYSTAAANADQRPCLPAPPGAMCGVWAADPTLHIPAGGTGQTTLSVYFTARTDPQLSVLTPLRPQVATVIVPDRTRLVANGDHFPLTVAVPADAPQPLDDVVPLPVECGDAAYVSWYYVRIVSP
jgi:hypothetical protein